MPRFRLRLRAVCAPVAALLALFAAAPAVAQINVPAPPVFESADRNGVDLVNGSLTVNLGTVSIGTLSNSITALDATGQGSYTRHSIVGGIAHDNPGGTSTVQLYTVTLMGEATVFNKVTSGAFFLRRGRGGTLTLAGGIYTFTTPDGSVAEFSSALRSWNDAALANTASITAITRPDGERIVYHYNGVTDFSLYLQSVTSSRGYQIHFQYGDGGALPTRVEAINNAIDACAHTANVCSLTQAWPSLTQTAGGIWTDAAGRTIVTSPSGVIWTAGYPTLTYQQIWGNTKDAVATLSDGAGTWSYAFGEPPEPGWVQDTSINTFTDPLGHATLVTVGWLEDSQQDPPPFLPSLRFVTDPVGNVMTPLLQRGAYVGMLYPEGNSERVTYNQFGVPTQYTYTPKPGSGLSPVSITPTYGDCSTPIRCRRPTAITDQRGHVTDFTYDAAGNVLSMTEPAPTTGAIRPQTRMAYAQQYPWFRQNGSSSITAAAQPIWVPVQTSACATTASCNAAATEVRTTTVYQAGSASVASNLLPVAVTSGSGNGVLAATTTTTWTPASDPATVDGPLPGTADTARTLYDTMRNPIGAIGPDPDGTGARLFLATRTTLNAQGQVASVEQGTTTGQTDPAWAAFSPLQTATTAYDAQARKVRDTAASGTADAMVTQYSYDAASRPTCATVRMNPATFGSLPASACTLATAGSFGPDRITLSTYDNADRLIASTRGHLSTTPVTESQTWTPNSQTATRIDGAGNLSTFTYDGLDRLSRLRFPNATGGGSSTTDYEDYTYDAANNPVTKRTRGGDTFTTTFDTLNRITRIVADSTGARAVPETRLSYDLLDRRLTACFWVGAACTQTVTSTWDGLSRQTTEAGALGTVTYGYDLAGRRTRITWPDTNYAAYAYDLSNQTTTITQGSSSLLATYSYNNLAQRTAVARPTNTVATAYGYDAAARLNALTQNLGGATTTYDQALGFTRSPASQLITRTASNTAYAFAPTNGTTAYTNNGRNQVTAAGGATITYETTTGGLSSGNIANDGTTAYTYDAANRLKSAGAITYAHDPLDRLYQENASLPRRFLYAGSQLIGEYDTAGAIQTRYIPGPGVDEPLAEYAGSAVTTPIFHVQDERGSIIARTISTAMVGTANAYDEYGVPAAGVTGRFQYTGQTRLTDTQLYYYKARVYSPTLGRFLQTDPIGYEAGLNLYAYVGADPVNGTDPTGMQSCGKTGMNCPLSSTIGSEPDGQSIQLPLDNPQAQAATLEAIGTGLSAIPHPGARLVGAGFRGGARLVPGQETSVPITPRGNPREGIYEFPDQANTGLPYVGQSGNIPSRLRTHERDGRMEAGTQSTTEVPGGRTARERAEHNRIQEITGGVPARQSNAVSNQRDPIGPRRRND